MEEILPNFEVSSPPFTRPFFYRHKSLSNPPNIIFEVDTTGHLRFSLEGLSPVTNLCNHLHIDAGDVVFHLKLASGEIWQSPPALGHEAKLVRTPTDEQEMLPATSSIQRAIENFLFLEIDSSTKVHWLHTREESPASAAISRGTLTGPEVKSFQEVLKLWYLMRKANPDVTTWIARPLHRHP